MINPHLPEPFSLRCLQISIEPDRITITVESTSPAASCPLCGRASVRVHSRYVRTLADLPWQGRPVRWRLRVRKFFCGVAGCPRRVFTERLPEVVAAWSRNSTRLGEALAAIAFTCGGEAGARLAASLGMPTSPDTLLRGIRRSAIPNSGGTRSLGIDDWAVRRGQRYGTILCDLDRHVPVDLLPDRSAESVAAWLHDHAGVQVITRDRASFYAEGASKGAPQAMQVADRFHLLKNLREVLVRMLEHRHRHMLAAARDVSAERSATTPATPDPPQPGQTRRLPHRPTRSEARGARRLERYEQVVKLHGQGVSQRAIAAQLGINRETIARYISAGSLPERNSRPYASSTDPFADYLLRRWNEGCRNAAQLMRELQTQGFTGSYCSVRRRVAHWDRDATSSGTGSSVATVVRPPSAKRLAWLLLREAVDETDPNRSFIEALNRRCPELPAAVATAREFAGMIHDHRGSGLDAWMERAWAPAMPRELRAFATGLKSDYDAVKAALTTAWSNGQVEGQVNRLKLIKRQMYGRAKFDLLRQRVLHTG